MQFKWVVCRVCLKNPGSGNMISINTDDLLLKIGLCGGVEISPTDNLPDGICKTCNSSLNSAFKFRMQCQSSSEQLSKFLTEETSSDSDEPVEELQEIEDEFDGSTCTKIEPVEVEEFFCENVMKEEEVEMLADSLDEYELFEEETIADEEMQEETYEDDQEISEYVDEVYLVEEQVVNEHYPEHIQEENNVEESVPKKSYAEHVCDTCGNVYPTKIRLNQHIRIHMSKAHECEICHKKFGQTVQLHRHMNTHTGNRPYSCKYCPSTFADPSTCIKHERIHTNERPYSCDTCGKSFSYSNVLKVHIMTHTGERPFECDICGKGFSQLHHMKSHRNTHLEEDEDGRKIIRKNQKRLKLLENK